MVTLDELEAFDLQTWLSDPELAAACMHCHPSTISRRSATVVDTFQLIKDCRRGYTARHHDWELLLKQQRQVHQHYRMMCRIRLRLHWQGGMLQHTAPPRGWWDPSREAEGHASQLNPTAVKQLINHRVLDAALVDGHLLVLPDLSSWTAVVELRQWLKLNQEASVETGRNQLQRHAVGGRLQSATPRHDHLPLPGA